MERFLRTYKTDADFRSLRERYLTPGDQTSKVLNGNAVSVSFHNFICLIRCLI
jgi:hypothetical protein